MRRLWCKVTSLPIAQRERTVTAGVRRWFHSSYCLLFRQIEKDKTYHPPGAIQAAMQMPMDHPELGKELNKLAKAAHSARNFQDAVSLYDRVLAHRRNSLGLQHSDVAATLHNLGRVFIDMREYANAENALTEACAIYEQSEGEKSLKYADSLGLLAVCYRDLKFYDEAEKAFKETLLIYRDLVYDHGPHSWIPADGKAPDAPNTHPLSSVAHTLADCGTLFVARGNADRGTVMLEEALEIRRFLYNAHSKFKPIIAQTAAKLAEVKRSAGHVVEAEMLINDAVDICIDTMGRESPATAAAISSKGNIHSVRQQYREALKCYEEACTTYAMAYGKTSPLVASELLHIGRMQELLNEFKPSERSFMRAIDIIKASLGENHIQMADANMYLAALLMKKADYDGAIPLLRRAIQLRSKYDPNDSNIVFLEHKLGDALAAKKEPEAEAHFLTAIEIHKQNAQKHDSESQKLLMTDVMDDLGLYYLEFKHYDKAEKTLNEALATRISMMGEKHQMVGYSYSNLSLMKLDQGKLQECEELCRKAIVIYETLQDDTWMPITDSYYTLGQCQRMMKQPTEALKSLVKCLNMRRTLGEQVDIQVAETLHEICKCELMMNDSKEAAQHLDEAVVLAEKYASIAGPLIAEMEKTKRSFPAIE